MSASSTSISPPAPFTRRPTKEELLGGLGEFFDEPALEVFLDEMATLAENNARFQREFVTRTLKQDERLVDMIVSVVDYGPP